MGGEIERGRRGRDVGRERGRENGSGRGDIERERERGRRGRDVVREWEGRYREGERVREERKGCSERVGGG